MDIKVITLYVTPGMKKFFVCFETISNLQKSLKYKELTFSDPFENKLLAYCLTISGILVCISYTLRAYFSTTVVKPSKSP